MSRQVERRQFRTTVIASILSIVFSSALALVPQVRDPKNARYAIPSLYILISLLLIGVIAYNLMAYLNHIRQIREETVSIELMNRAVPRLVTFQRREDTYIIKANGNGTLIWDFDLASQPQDHIPSLTFPVYAEVSTVDAPPVSVAVDLIEVNGQRRAISDAYRLIEHRFPKDRGPENRDRIDFGLLRVPVDLGSGRESCHVRVQLSLFKCFRNVFVLNPVFIDIPYLTEQLTVKVMSDNYAVGPSPLAPDGNTIIAMSGIMHTVDQVETASQTSLCDQREAALIWKSSALKLGYRYKLWFRLEEL